MKNLLTQWEMRRKTEWCALLPSPKGYAEEEMRDPCIVEKPPKLDEKTRRKTEKMLLHSTS